MSKLLSEWSPSAATLELLRLNDLDDALIENSLRGQVEIILSTPRACLGHQCKARFAGNGRSLAKKRNTAVMVQVRPNVNIISTCPLSYLKTQTELEDIDRIDGYDSWNAFFIMFCIKAAGSPHKLD
jgi:hypothetical protein